MYQKLAEIPGLGQAVLCQNCEDVHLSIGNAAFRLPKDMFRDMCRMLQEAAKHPLLDELDAARFSVRFEDGRPRFKPAAGR
jgi:hypothetical protein